MTIAKRLLGGQYVEIEDYICGLKLVVIYEVHLRLTVAAKVAPISQHDTNFSLDLLQQARDNVGEKVIQVLLPAGPLWGMDMGFLDVETLWTTKHTHHIDFVVPSKDNTQITREARSFRKMKADGTPGYEHPMWLFCSGPQTVA